MYVSWTLISLDIALIVNALWLALFLPIALIYMHILAILREERDLERKFRDEYQQYKKRVH